MTLSKCCKCFPKISSNGTFFFFFFYYLNHYLTIIPGPKGETVLVAAQREGGAYGGLQILIPQAAPSCYAPVFLWISLSQCAKQSESLGTEFVGCVLREGPPISLETTTTQLSHCWCRGIHHTTSKTHAVCRGYSFSCLSANLVCQPCKTATHFAHRCLSYCL